MAERAGRGSLAGRWSARVDQRPNLTGAITLERDLPAGTKLWVSGWTRSAAGCEEFVALVVNVADGGPRKTRSQARHRDEGHGNEPEGKFSSVAKGADLKNDSEKSRVSADPQVEARLR